MILDFHNSKITDIPHLTPRELQILKLLALSKNNEDIATTLNIKDNTVKTYKRNLFKKLYVGYAEDAIEYAKLFCLI